MAKEVSCLVARSAMKREDAKVGMRVRLTDDILSTKGATGLTATITFIEELDDNRFNWWPVQLRIDDDDSYESRADNPEDREWTWTSWDRIEALDVHQFAEPAAA